MQSDSANLKFRPSAEYNGDYVGHLLQQYQLCVEMADRVSARRMQANSFFLTTNTVLLAVGGFLREYQSHDLAVIFISVVGAMISIAWIRSIQSFKDLNSGKFAVINAIEDFLPINPFEAEWAYLKRGNDKSVYRPFHHVERLVPRMFFFLYAVLLVFGAFDLINFLISVRHLFSC